MALALVTGAALVATVAQPAEAATKPPPAPCSKGYVSLSFDDSPTALTPTLLAALKTAKLNATFFDVGTRAQQFPKHVTAQHAAGHWVGNHTYSHPDLVALGEPGALSEMSKTQAVLTPLAGSAPTLFRPPFGSTSAQVKFDAASLGMTEVVWTADTNDWAPATTTASIVSSALSAGAGGFVLMHDGYQKTINAIPKIAAGLADRGLCAGKIIYSSVPTVAWDGGPAFNATVAAPTSTAPTSPPPPSTGPPAMSALADNFDSASLNTSLWDGSSVGVVGQSGGQAVVPCNSAYPGIGTNSTYDLTNSGAFAQFTLPPVGNGSREAFFQLASGSNTVQWARSGSAFWPRYSVGEIWTEGPALTYDAVADGWWRIHQVGANVLWDTSANGLTWTNVWSVPTPFAVTAMSASVVCGSWGTETAAALNIDNFNVAPA
ncbi:MAG: polysaccharide deacetylase family protein [Actinomycetota bacterium]|nr:polysaccharide deacetylase family protein [Actinomycetota bacterium]